MGWKSFKKKFNITHLVQIRDNKLLIGSPYVSDLVEIDLKSGVIKSNDTFNDFVRKNYPQLEQATPDEILSSLAEEDKFDASIPVYYFEDGKIVKDFAENAEWPNPTHKGKMIYSNSVFLSAEELIKYEIESQKGCIKSLRGLIKNRKFDIKEFEKSIKKHQKNIKTLQISRTGKA